MSVGKRAKRKAHSGNGSLVVCQLNNTTIYSLFVFFSTNTHCHHKLLVAFFRGLSSTNLNRISLDLRTHVGPFQYYSDNNITETPDEKTFAPQRRNSTTEWSLPEDMSCTPRTYTWKCFHYARSLGLSMYWICLFSERGARAKLIILIIQVQQSN